MSKKLSREGHRQRLRDSYLLNGADGIPQHNLLELILTYAIPRRDVKETAYGLFNHFGGDIKNVITADADELKKVKGVGESAAALIKLFGDIPQAYFYERSENTDAIYDYVSGKEFVRANYFGVKNEQLVLICLNNSGGVINCTELEPKALFSEKGDLRDVIATVVESRAASAVLVHALPDSRYEPTDSDIKLVKRISAALSPLGIQLSDYMVSGKDGVLSMTNDIRYIYCFCN